MITKGEFRLEEFSVKLNVVKNKEEFYFKG